jgi:uncharacterized protein (DUF2461 family)
MQVVEAAPVSSDDEASTISTSSDQRFDCVGDYGTKISGIITDIKRRMQENANTFKAVVFSAWNQYLNIFQEYVIARLPSTFHLRLECLLTTTSCRRCLSFAYRSRRALNTNGIANASLLGNIEERATSLAEFRKPIDTSSNANVRILLISMKNREGREWRPCNSLSAIVKLVFSVPRHLIQALLG